MSVVKSALVASGILLACLGCVHSQPVRTDEQSISCAKASFFAYESPIAYSGSNVPFLDAKFVEGTFNGAFNVLVHNLSASSNLSGQVVGNVSVEISTPFTLFYTNSVPLVGPLVFEAAGIVPCPHILGASDVLTLSLIVSQRLPITDVTTLLLGGQATAFKQNVAASVSIPLASFRQPSPRSLGVTLSDGSVVALTVGYNATLPPVTADSGLEQWSYFSNWTALEELFPDPLGLRNVTYVAFIDSFYTSTQLWIARNEATKQVLVAFRGTQELVPDYITDFNTTLVPFRPEDVGQQITAATPLVHGGFYKAFMSVAAQVFGIINACVTAGDGWSVTVTGHSLGAAVATVAAGFIADYPDARYNHTRLYNYGSPRVGNTAYAQSYGVDDTFRHFNSLDNITTIPPRLQTAFSSYGLELPADYCHVFPSVNITSAGDYIVNGRNATDPYTSDADLLQQVSAFVASPETFGGAFDHHLEATYFETLTNMALKDLAANNSAGNPPGPSPPPASSSARASHGAVALLILGVIAVALLNPGV